MSTRKILVPEEELHNIADAINDRADYVDDLNHVDHDDPQSAHNRMIENSERQMATRDMANNILQLTVDLSQFYTKEEIDAMFAEKTFKLAFGSLPDRGEEGTFYIINKSYSNSATNDNGIDLSVYIWRNGSFNIIHNSKISLAEYAKKSEIPADYQKQLTAGSGISITGANRNNISVIDYDKLSALITGSSDTPFKLTLSSITNNVAKFRISSNYNNDPVMSMIGYSPILLRDSGSNVSISIDPDNLLATTMPQTDRSTHVATTEFVKTAIENIPSGGEGTLKYELIPEGGDVPVRQSDTLYLELGTGRATIGYDEIQPPLRWHMLDDTIYIYIQYNSGLQEIENTINGTPVSNESGLIPYTDVFNDMWAGTYTPTWSLTYNGQNVPYTEGTTTMQQICEDLHISDYGDEERSVMTATPTISTSVPFLGYFAGDNGCFNNSGLHIQSYLPSDGYDGNIKETLTLHTNKSLRAVDYVYCPGYECTGWSETPESEDAGQTSNLYIDGYWTGTIYPVWNEKSYSTVKDFIKYFDNPIFSDKTSASLSSSTEFTFTNYIDSAIEVNKLEIATIPVWTYDSASDTYTIDPKFTEAFDTESIELPTTRESQLDVMNGVLDSLLYDEESQISWTVVTTPKFTVSDTSNVEGKYLVLRLKDNEDVVIDQFYIFITTAVYRHVSYICDFGYGNE